MAKELPYFKFDCGEWLTGDITLEDDNVQGIFITLCAYYWKQNCSTPIGKLKKRCKNDMVWDKLIESNIIKTTEDVAYISFLDEQWEARQVEHKSKSDSGKLGAAKRWHTHSTPNKVPMAKHGNKDVDVDVDKEVDKDKSFKSFWDSYHKITGLPKTDYQATKKYFDKLNKTEQQKAVDNIQEYYDCLPMYQTGKPIKKARTYLSDKSFNDEFVKQIVTTKRKIGIIRD